MCRRDGQSFLAFLPGRSEERARTWANEAAALAAMISARGDGSRLIALRARAAALSRHPGFTPMMEDEPIMSEQEAREVKAAILSGLAEPEPAPEPGPRPWMPQRMTRAEVEAELTGLRSEPA